jgi:hypothetical protein
MPCRKQTLRCASALEYANTVQDVPNPVQHGVTDDNHEEFKPVGLIADVQFRRLSRKMQLDRVFVVKVTAEGGLDTNLPDVSLDMAELVCEFTPDVFRDEVPAGLPPDRGIDHMIKLQPGAKPFFKPMYRPSPLEMQALEREINSLLSKGLIEPSSAAYGASILFVTKKPTPGTPPGAPVELRVVIDFRKLML